MWISAFKSSCKSLRDNAANTDAAHERQCPHAVSYTHLRAHETGRNLVCRLLLEKKKKKINKKKKKKSNQVQHDHEIKVKNKQNGLNDNRL